MPPDPQRDPDEPLGSPYGPHPHGVDESAGGADSSPYENEPSEERQDVAEDEVDAEDDVKPSR